LEKGISEPYNTIEFQVSGKYALFSDPITKVGKEKCTYLVPTYEALKGILMSVYWKPTLIWYIDKVRIMNPIRTEAVGIRTISYFENKSDLSYYTYLTQCEYQVQAHFEWNENRPELSLDRNPGKHDSIARRMIKKGGRRDIFLGTRECQGYVKPCIFGEGEGAYDRAGQLAFGLMYHGITYPDEAYSKETRDRMTINFWNPVMKNGVIDFLRPDQCPVHKPGHEMEMKMFEIEEGDYGTVAAGV